MKEKIKKILIIGTVIIILAAGFWQYRHQKDVNFCKDICVYIPGGEIWKVSSEAPRQIKEKLKTSNYFPELQQCIDYCLRNK